MQTNQPSPAVTPDPYLPSNPGFCYKLHIRPDPNDPTVMVRGWKRLSHSLVYRDKNGALHSYHPGEKPEVDAEFRTRARQGVCKLVSRSERRTLWAEEKRRYKRILAARGASEVSS